MVVPWHVMKYEMELHWVPVVPVVLLWSRGTYQFFLQNYTIIYLKIPEVLSGSGLELTVWTAPSTLTWVICPIFCPVPKRQTSIKRIHELIVQLKRGELKNQIQGTVKFTAPQVMMNLIVDESLLGQVERNLVKSGQCHDITSPFDNWCCCILHQIGVNIVMTMLLLWYCYITLQGKMISG